MPGHRHTRPGDGESAPFHFETTWKAGADLGRVWEALSDISSWPGWWPGMHRVEMAEDGLHGDLVVQSPLGYRLHFTLCLVEKHTPRGAAFSVAGDLRGVGTVHLRPAGETTVVTIMWCVVTRRRLLGRLRPAAVAAHNMVMAAGQRGLRRTCGAHGNGVTGRVRRLAG
ncbi:SRPBCC family protein [Corynebacterium comes]|uniref:Polyketide cyclase / dehydrase and lipid transport n=1 Tax=Corynebacterium comes TaxID=2675218 RepID=A0A6B8VMB3_9CORY|nr:SRPBCC family protein [Corynebacterium comes]QGU04229.1 Polyketide cyclase / dehydrase and lipid transport [Corynebacterium comes]